MLVPTGLTNSTIYNLPYDLISTLVLFFIIFLFNYFNTRSKKLNPKKGKIENLDLFVKRKKTIALFLLPVLIFLAVSSLFKWIYIEVASVDQVFFSIQDINELFFNEFFTVLNNGRCTIAINIAL